MLLPPRRKRGYSCTSRAETQRRLGKDSRGTKAPHSRVRRALTIRLQLTLYWPILRLGGRFVCTNTSKASPTILALPALRLGSRYLG
jgi:hypothetical protein